MDYETLVRTLSLFYGRPHEGKVRDSFRFGYEGKRYRLVVASDRISIFDFILGFLVPWKGYVLTALTIFWRLYLRKKLGKDYTDDLVAFGPAINQYLLPQLHSNPQLCRELWRRALVVEELDIIPIENVERAWLTGSGFRTYQKTLLASGGSHGLLCGHRLPPGLRDGEKLPQPIATPTTKAEQGHDMEVPIQRVRRQYPGFEQMGRLIASAIRELCLIVGLLYVDGKREFGLRPGNPHQYVHADEDGTPDSSRFWDEDEYTACWPDSLPSSPDKEPVRTEGRKLGIHLLNPENPEHRLQVKAMVFPPEVATETTNRYVGLFARITGVSLETFWRDTMLIPVGD